MKKRRGDGETGRTEGEASPNVSRREMMKLTATALVVPALPQAKQAAIANPQAQQPRFFTADELALVDELSELIIPADEHSPGARAAKAAEYIDERLAETLEEKPKQDWRDGLKLVDQLSIEMHGKAFMQSSPDQRIALLTRIAANEESPQKPEEKFFVELKSRVAHAYYTSKIGIHQELEYKGNTYLREFA
ncbi:MAG: gluconate 2-dehydrogenase subunit 3 family protein, partial [Acidobacteriota bacterium]